MTDHLGKYQVAKFTSAFLLALLLSGCGNRDQARLVGTWQLETADSIAKRIGAGSTKTAPATAQKVIDAAADADINQARMLVQFLSNGQLVTTTRMGSINRQKKGTWQWIEFDSVSKIATVKCMIGMQETEHQIEFVEDDVIEMVPPNLAGLTTRLKFERIQANMAN